MGDKDIAGRQLCDGELPDRTPDFSPRLLASPKAGVPRLYSVRIRKFLGSRHCVLTRAFCPCTMPSDGVGPKPLRRLRVKTQVQKHKQTPLRAVDDWAKEEKHGVPPPSVLGHAPAPARE